MISSPLFIIVAESMVTFGPMFQVGCASASAGVIDANVSSGAAQERPAAGGEHEPRDRGGVLAAQALPERRVLAVDRDDACPGGGRPGLDELAGHDQDLLGGGGDGGARVDRGQRRPDRGGAGDGDADHVGVHRGDLARGVDAGRAARRAARRPARGRPARCASRRTGSRPRRAPRRRSPRPHRPARTDRGTWR